MPFEFLRKLVSAKLPGAEGVSAGEEAEIYVLLRRAFNARCLLTVFVGPQHEAYTSAILEVVRDGRYLVIDELAPSGGHAHMSPDREIEVRALVDGNELRFHTRVLQIGEDDGLPYYKVAFPRAVEYAQKRERYRVPVPMNQRFEVQLVFDDDREVSGELRDLSPGGLSARIHTGWLDPVVDRNAIVMCRLALSREASILTDIEIRHVHSAQHPRVPRFGGRFVKPSPTAARRIAQFCADLERLRRKS